MTNWKVLEVESDPSRLLSVDAQAELLKLSGFCAFVKSHNCDGRAGPGDCSVRLT